VPPLCALRAAPAGSVGWQRGQTTAEAASAREETIKARNNMVMELVISKMVGEL
jgi:hypothetical protein